MTDLCDLISEMDWDDWHDTNDGVLHFVIDKTVTKFYCRIGLHIKRPMEAIIAKGQFVRMRSAAEYQAFDLERLDAENPDRCLYPAEQGGYAPNQIIGTYQTVSTSAVNMGFQQLPGFYSPKDWIPKYPKGWRDQQAAQYRYQQQQLQAQQQAMLLRQQALHPWLSSCGGGGAGTFLGYTTGGTTQANTSTPWYQSIFGYGSGSSGGSGTTGSSTI